MERAAKHLEYQVRQFPFNLVLSEEPPAPGLISRILRWRELARQRRELARLSDEMLKDIGISRVDALRESKRPFWDEPL